MQLSADTKDKVYIHRKRYKEGVKNKTRLYTSRNLRGLKRDMTFYKAYSCSTNILLEESEGGGGEGGEKKWSFSISKLWTRAAQRSNKIRSYWPKLRELHRHKTESKKTQF